MYLWNSVTKTSSREKTRESSNGRKKHQTNESNYLSQLELNNIDDGS